MTTKEMIAVLQAHDEGKQIQFRPKTNIGSWFEMGGELSWNFFSYDYRVKPEPPKPREWWLGTCRANSSTWKVWDDKPPIGCSQCEIVRVREVLEETKGSCMGP